MQVHIGFLKSPQQVLIKQLDWNENALERRTIDFNDIESEPLNALFIQDQTGLEETAEILDKEKHLYPILESTEFDLSAENFESLEEEKVKAIFTTVTNRWTLHQNLTAIKEMVATAEHFRELWSKDRLTFFEELWYWLKRQLGSTSLSIVFNDVDESQEKAKLIQSMLHGKKKAHFESNQENTALLTQEYQETYQEGLEITEYDPHKKRMVATLMIEGSPIIIMAQVDELNNLQRAILEGTFKGMTVAR